MNLEHAAAVSTSRSFGPSDVHLSGSFRLLTRGGWLVLVILTLATFFASLPTYVALLQTPCAGPACQYQQLTPGQVETFQRIGLSLDDYVAYTVAFTLASVLICLVASTLIVWRRSDDRMALLVALMLLTFGPVSMINSVPRQVPNVCLGFLAQALIVLVFLLFPTGQFVPHWMRWTLVVFLAGLVVPFVPNTPVSQLGWLVFFSELATLAVVQLYRYRRVSSPMQRQQTRWVIFGLAVLTTVAVSVSVPYLIFPVLAEPGSLYPLAFNVIGTLLPLFLALSFGFAILRSRLWEIDVLINRTLVYGAFTVSLTGAYVGLILGLSALLRGFISQDSSVAIVISTLAIAALFQPLRRRIQAMIDQRFYRRKYDAARVMADFSTTLRQEVDLDQLREQLVAVVQETMQPSHVSLWLRSPEPSRKRKTWPLARIYEEEKVEL